MLSSSTFSLIGWSLSVLLYIFILIGVSFMLQSSLKKDIKYTPNKKKLLNITLVERQNKNQEQLKKKKVVKKKNQEVKKDKPKRAKKVTKKPDFKKLFSNVDLKKLPDPVEKRAKKVRKKVVKKEIEEVRKSEIANKIRKNLDFEKQNRLLISSNEGVYDKFKGEITNILESNWQSTIDTVSGSTAEVIIGIDKFGNFSYEIETLSYNDKFNAKLRDFLEEMKSKRFPPFEGGDIFHMKTTFKDIME